MATKAEVVAFIEGKYKCEHTESGAIKVLFNEGDGRSQIVLAWVNDSNIQVSSPFAKTSEISADRAVAEVSKYSLGMQIYGEFYVVRHVAYLADIDASEVFAALEVTSSVADELEKALLGGDKY